MTAEGASAARIRVLEAGDLPAIVDLVAEMQDFERGLDRRLLEGRSMAAAYTEAMLARCHEESGTILVAEAEGQVVGFVAVLCAVLSTELDQPPGRYALVSDLSVTESHRSQGIGRSLLAGGIEHARASGARELRIAVLAANRGAESLYRSVGFEPYLNILELPL